MIDPYTISVIVFLAIVGVVIYLDRKNIEFKYVILIRRTKTGIEILDKLAQFKTFWKVVSTIGIFAGIALAIFGIFSFVQLSLLISSGVDIGPTGGVLLPSFTSETQIGVGYIAIPFWFWIVIIPTIMFPHEIAHGIMSRLEKIKVTSVGLILALIIPGAFVEPDEKQLKKSRLISKLRIFAAGSFANLIVAFILINPFLGVGLVPNVIWPAFVPSQTQVNVLLTNVTSNSPAEQAGLMPGMIITEINRIPVEVNYFDYNSGTFFTRYLSNVSIGDRLDIVANGTDYTVIVGNKTENNVSRPYLGIAITFTTSGEKVLFNFLMGEYKYDPNTTYSVLSPGLLYWLFAASFAVAMLNIMPIYPLDGGLIMLAISEKLSKKYHRQIALIITLIMIGLVVFTIMGPFIVSALRSF